MICDPLNRRAAEGLGRAVTTALLSDTELERDQRLVERFHSGDANAFGELYALHYPRLLRFCTHKVHDAHLAEELAQETFVKAYGALEFFRGGRSFYPWLTVIATRSTADYYRRNGRVLPRAEVDLGTVDDAQDDLVREVEREQIRTALGRVRGRHQEVLRLRDWEDLSYEDIAQRMGTSPTVVQALLHRARAAVRREYLALAESAALLPGASAISRLSQRARLRAGRATAWLPNPTSLATPLAAAAVAIGVALGPAVEVPAPATPAGASAPLTPSESAGAPLTPIVGSRHAPASDTASSTVTQRGRLRKRAATILLGRRGVERTRERSESMPAHVDSGAAFVGLDPAAVLRDTTAATGRLLGGRLCADC